LKVEIGSELVVKQEG